MIELNLLPEDMRIVQKAKKSIDFKMPDIPVIPAIIVGATVILLIHIIIAFFAVTQRGQLKTLTKAIDDKAISVNPALNLTLAMLRSCAL